MSSIRKPKIAATEIQSDLSKDSYNEEPISPNDACSRKTRKAKPELQDIPQKKYHYSDRLLNLPKNRIPFPQDIDWLFFAPKHELIIGHTSDRKYIIVKDLVTEYQNRFESQSMNSYDRVSMITQILCYPIKRFFNDITVPLLIQLHTIAITSYVGHPLTVCSVGNDEMSECLIITSHILTNNSYMTRVCHEQGKLRLLNQDFSNLHMKKDYEYVKRWNSPNYLMNSEIGRRELSTLMTKAQYDLTPGLIYSGNSFFIKELCVLIAQTKQNKVTIIHQRDTRSNPKLLKSFQSNGLGLTENKMHVFNRKGSWYIVVVEKECSRVRFYMIKGASLIAIKTVQGRYNDCLYHPKSDTIILVDKGWFYFLDFKTVVCKLKTGHFYNPPPQIFAIDENHVGFVSLVGIRILNASDLELYKN